MDDRWKTAKAKTARSQTAAYPAQFLDHLRTLKGFMEYHQHGEGSLRDEGDRPPGGRQPQVNRYTDKERREMDKFSGEIKKVVDVLEKFWKDARKIDEFINQ